MRLTHQQYNATDRQTDAHTWWR